MPIYTGVFESQTEYGKEDQVQDNPDEIQKAIECYKDQMNMEMSELQLQNETLRNKLTQLMSDKKKTKKTIKIVKQEKLRQKMERIKAEQKLKSLQAQLVVPLPKDDDINKLKPLALSQTINKKDIEMQLKKENEVIKQQAAKQIAKLQRQLYNKECELAEMRDLLENYHGNYEYLETEFDAGQLLLSETNNDVIQLLLDSLTKEVQYNESEEFNLQSLTKLTTQISKMTKDYAELEKNWTQSKEESATLKLDISVLNRLLAEKETENKQLVEVIEQQKVFEADNVRANEEIAVLKVNIEHTRQELEIANQKAQEFFSTNEDLRSQIDKIREEAAKVEDSIDAEQKAKISALTLENSQLAERIADVGCKSKDIETIFAQLEEQDKALQNRMYHLKKVNKDCTDRVIELLLNVDNCEQAKHCALAESSHLEELLDINDIELDKQEQELVTLKDALASLQKQQTEAKELNTQLTTMLEQMENDQRAELMMKEEEIVVLNNNLLSLEHKLMDVHYEKENAFKAAQPKLIALSPLEEDASKKSPNGLESILITPGSKRKQMEDINPKGKPKQVRFGNVEQRFISSANTPRYEALKPVRTKLDFWEIRNKISPTKSIYAQNRPKSKSS